MKQTICTLAMVTALSTIALPAQAELVIVINPQNDTKTMSTMDTGGRFRMDLPSRQTADTALLLQRLPVYRLRLPLGKTCARCVWLANLRL